MDNSFFARIGDSLEQLRNDGLYKSERLLEGPQSPLIRVPSGREVINLCANNYLGLANHPRVCQAAHEAIEHYGFGMASVRFICGTQTVHRELERQLSGFLGTEDTVLYSSCFDANGGLFETILGGEDAIISDSLNHASIIDGIRLCKAARYRYRNRDLDDLERCLKEARSARTRLIVTDGVFSMDGTFAPLEGICDLAERYDALVAVDDSHATGFIGAHGRGTPERAGVASRVDILTGTLGKALGGASGGYVSGRRALVEWLRQRSRPYLFSNSIPPVVAATTLTVLGLIAEGAGLRAQLEANAHRFRAGLAGAGFHLVPGEHPIIPVMIGDAGRAARMAERLLELGVYVIGFSFPVVPQGQARIRTQMTAAHTAAQLDRAVLAFAQAGRDVGILG